MGSLSFKKRHATNKWAVSRCWSKTMASYHPLVIGAWHWTMPKRITTQLKKSLAVFLADLQLRPYIEDSRFIVRMDYQSLRWILDLKMTNGHLACLRLRILQVYFMVHHRPGQKCTAANDLSLLSANLTENFDIEKIMIFIIADIHVVTDHNTIETVEPLT